VELKKHSSMLVVLAAAAFFMASLFYPSTSMSADTIKIGVVGPRTGSAAATGTAFEEGIALALDYINGKGGLLGKKIEVVFEDTGGVPEKGVAAFEKLVNRDKVPLVVGTSHSSVGIAISEQANRYKAPFIVAESWADEITAKNYRYIFRAGPCNSGVVSEIIKWVKAEGFKKATVVAENTDWGLGIKKLTVEALEKANIEFQTIDTERNSKDHYTELSKIKKYDPEVILAFVYGFGVHYLIAQANEIGLTPKAVIFEGAGPPSLWPQFWENVGDAGNFECFISSMHKSAQPNQVAKDYWDNYVKKFGKDPSDYKSRSIYRVLLIAFDAIEKANSLDGDKLVDALEKSNVVVPSGQVKFSTEKGSVWYHQFQPPMLIIQWQDRQQVVIFPENVATGKLIRK